MRQVTDYEVMAEVLGFDSLEKFGEVWEMMNSIERRCLEEICRLFQENIERRQK